jgi:hypothetical protein
MCFDGGWPVVKGGGQGEGAAAAQEMSTREEQAMHGGYAHEFAGTVTLIHRMLALFVLCFCRSLVTSSTQVLDDCFFPSFCFCLRRGRHPFRETELYYADNLIFCLLYRPYQK